MKRILSSLVAVVLLASAAPVKADIILDNFQNGTNKTADVGGTNPNGDSQTGLSGVLGGSRDTSVFASTGVTGATAQLLISTGVLQLNTGTGVAGVFSLTYPNVAPLDLSTAIAFIFDISANDNGGTFVLDITDGTNTGSSTLLAGPLGSTTGDGVTGPQSIAIAGNPDFSGVNLGAVTGITLNFTGDDSTDLEIGPLGFRITTQVIPEPASMAVWGLLGLSVTWYARRKRRQLQAA